MVLFVDENTTGGRRDFDNTIIEFEILTGDDTYEIQIGNIISEDDVNEDLEQFILVLEFESNEVVFEGTSRGILIVTILDNNGKYSLVLFIYSCLYSYGAC